MGFNLDRQNIEQHFVDNLKYTLRFEGNNYPNDETPFVGVIIDPVSRENSTVDNLSAKTDGFIRLRVFTDSGQGTKEILDICDEITAIIDNKTIGTVTTYAAENPKKLKTNNAYLAKEISIPYYSN